MPDVIGSLTAIVGAEHILTDAVSVHQQDYTGRYQGEALAIVRPANTTEIASVIELCAKTGIAVVTQGGNTGLVGGSTPRGGELVLTTGRLSGVEIDESSALVGAGVTLADLRTAASAAGRRFPLDIASRDSATVGGMIGTNAGGAHAAVAGNMGRQLIGVECVLADGTIVDELDAGGEMLALIAGSEGTLAVITRARLRLLPPLGATVSVLVGVSSSVEAGEIVRSVKDIEAAEFFYRNGLEQVCAAFQLGDPLAQHHPCYLLLEATGEVEAWAGALGSVAEEAVAIGSSAADRERLWRYREGHTDAIIRRGIPIKADVKLPQDRIDDFAAGAMAAVAALYPQAATFVYGHFLDGDLHVNITGADPTDHRVDEAIYQVVADVGGSIIGEHGIGIAKAHLIHMTESPDDIAEMMATKERLDPRGLLNPGVRVPGAERP
ncbi:MAG: FAD-binding oxidoreductase [Acidimicrobiia bacterium]|nr:FAD-binding oxidoreductase [Acidimicrobiia bacterium]